MYKPGGTIADVLGRIQRQQYVLPAIQREFVWKPEQINRLFDSLMQGYPFGTFLFWKVEAETSGKFKFYDFVLNYHQRDAAHCPELPLQYDHEITAVLDGQQRLTALNIGLRGSMAIKVKHQRWNNPAAFPRKVLRLNLLSSSEPDEDGIIYDFRFLSDEQVKTSANENEVGLWFNVPDILGMKTGPSMLQWLTDRGLIGEDLNTAFSTLDRLHQVIHTNPLIHFYEEDAQDLERVLSIFIRLNSGGTVLSYSDLLLSIAVAQWEHKDARSEIHQLVDELNRIGTDFSFSQDFVLKAGLMLADIASVGFKVKNFTQANMAKLEKDWSGIRNALVQTVELVSSFGLNGQTLRAESAILPIAYYLHHSAKPDNYVTHSRYTDERQLIRGWLIRSLLKSSGIWGSGLDTLLTALRDVIKEDGGESFPVDQLRKSMDTRGKSLSFSEAEIDELLEMEYGDKRLFALLSLLFPFVDLRNQFHIDHIFPKSRFSKTKLKKAEFSEENFDDLKAKANQLSNLQLLEGPLNTEKHAILPAQWLASRFSSEADHGNYCRNHLLGEVPEKIIDCEEFWDVRRGKLRKAIKDVVGS